MMSYACVSRFRSKLLQPTDYHMHNCVGPASTSSIYTTHVTDAVTRCVARNMDDGLNKLEISHKSRTLLSDLNLVYRQLSPEYLTKRISPIFSFLFVPTGIGAFWFQFKHLIPALERHPLLKVCNKIYNWPDLRIHVHFLKIHAANRKPNEHE